MEFMKLCHSLEATILWGPKKGWYFVITSWPIAIIIYPLFSWQWFHSTLRGKYIFIHLGFISFGWRGFNNG